LRKLLKTLLSQIFTHSALGFANILTDLQPFGNSGFSWNGNSGATALDWASEQPSDKGDCATFNKMGLSSTSCTVRSNFMCEEKPAAAAAVTNPAPQTPAVVVTEAPTEPITEPAPTEVATTAAAITEATTPEATM
jgi:hypothetical protein